MANARFINALRSAGGEGIHFCSSCLASRRRFLALTAQAGAALAATSQSAFAQARKVAGGPVTDFHTHMGDRELLAAVGVRAGSGVMEKMLSPAAHIADMDRFGVDRHVVTMSNAVQGISWGDARKDIEIYRRINDEIASEWVGKYPTRFLGAFSLPTQDMRLSVAELERCATDLKMKMVQISSVTPDGIYYGDPRLAPFWEAVRAHNLIVFIHPHGNADAPPLDQFGLANSVGQGIEEAKVMSSIIYQGIFDRYPGVKILVAHGGGFLPHYTGRMDRNITNAPGSTKNISKKPSEYMRSFFYDSCVYDPTILTALIKIVGVDRVVLGGDYPVGVLDSVAELRETKSLSTRDIEAIAVRNAARLLA